MTSFQFLQLPKDVQAEVYAKMHAQDRVKLNMTLPQQEKINTKNKDKDDKLALATYYFKKRPNAKITKFMHDFIKTHKDDPSIKEIINKHSVSLYDNFAVRALIDDIKGNVVGIRHLLCEYPRYETLSKDDINAIYRAVLYHGTTDMLKQFPDIDLLRHVFANIQQNVLSDYVIHLKQDMLVELLTNRIRYGITDDAIDRFIEVRMLKVFMSREDTLRIIMDMVHKKPPFDRCHCINVAAEAGQQLLEHCLEQGFFEPAKVLMKEYGVQL